MKLGIDPGHGFSNRTPGLFDPGAVNHAFQEADIVLRYGLALEDEAQRRGWPTFMTRRDNETSTPLRSRVPRALAEGCTLLISIHCNAAQLTGARGTETLYYMADGLAQKVQAAALKALGLLDRGTKLRDDLAVLKFPQAALLELGFITNARDLAAMMQPEAPARLATAICDAFDPS